MRDNHQTFTVKPIGWVESPFGEKFGVPRQSGLVQEAQGILKLAPEFSKPAVVDGLSEFSHIWVLFLFHHACSVPWKESVRPPRLGGNIKKGVFASRSPFRPNHIGMSVLKLLDVDTSDGVKMSERGLDLVDQTPMIDINFFPIMRRPS
jgi:tRNA-Thr(GGU) m(6)t(6)A37 methyltransferase TsaA